MTRQAIFDAVKAARGVPWTPPDIAALDAVLDNLGVPNASPGASAGQQRISEKGLSLIKRSEGLKLKAYRDPIGVLTIGYGSTGEHVHEGMTITEAEAEALLEKDLDRFERGVTKLAGPMPQGQFDALVSFAFNLGLAALENSTLLKLHKAGKFEEAAQQFGRWTRAGGRVLPGLVTRRADEASLYRGQA